MIIIIIKMLSKSLKSNLLFTRISAGIDTLACQRSMQSLRQYSSSEKSGEEEEAAQGWKSDDENNLKNKNRQRRAQMEAEAINYEKASQSNQELMAYLNKHADAQLENRYRHNVTDEQGRPILTKDEEDELAQQQEIMQENQPFVKRHFNMEEYNDWRKEVDQEAIRTQQKIEHYKRSEELLKAIQQRIESATDKASQKELQGYLLAKLGYKNSSYTDFINNQMIHNTADSKAEAKRSSLLKSHNEAEQAINYNDEQVRDSSTLQSKHAWNPDSFLPSSVFDQIGYQKERKLMTQQEYAEARAQDAQELMDKRLLWAGHEHRLTDEQLDELQKRKDLGKLLTEQPETLKELMKDIDISNQVQGEPEVLSLRSFSSQKDRLELQEKELNEQEAALEKEENEILEKIATNLQSVQVELQQQDEVDPDTIKSEDITLPEVSESEGTIKRRELQFQKLENASSEEVEEALNNGPYLQEEQYNDIKPAEIEKVAKSFQQDPKPFNELFEQALKMQELEQEEKMMDEKYEIPEQLMDKEQEIDPNEKALIFFEEQQLYRDFAKSFLEQNGDGMNAEEQAKLKEIQELIREHERPKIPESDDDFFSMSKEEIEMRRSAHPFTALQEEADIFALNKSDQDDNVMPALDFDKFTREQQGTYEGTRRFERVDRVSLDAGNDKFDKLKLQAKHGRVFDQMAAYKAIEDVTIASSTQDLTSHMMEAVELGKEEIATDSATEQEGAEREREIDVYNILEKEEFVEEQMPEGLSKKEQALWKEEQAAAKLQDSKDKQIQRLHGNVDRPFYQEDWIHRKEGSEMLTAMPSELAYESVTSAGLIDELTEQFKEAKSLENKIITARKELAGKLQEQKSKLDQVFSNHETLRKKLMKSSAAQESQMGPGKISFFRDPKLTRFGTAEKEVQLKTQFNGDSKVAADYEAELLSISKLGLFKAQDKKDSLLRQFEFVFDSIKANNISLTPKIRAHMFEYLAVRNDFRLANNQLQFLTNDMTESASPIDTQYLQFYLKNCLQHDQIDGVAYLTNYFQRYHVDTSAMPLHKFHSMLDFYLNHNFDLSKVMIFCKFYCQFYSDTLKRELPLVLTSQQKPGTLDELQLKQLQKQVFSKHESLVDMRALSKFLVRKTGSKQIIDPLTKEDSLASLINMFTQTADVYQASSMSKNNHIEPETIAEYFAHRLNHTSTLESILKLALRLDTSQAGREFSAKMLAAIKDHASKHGMPASFQESVLRNVYYKLRASKVQLSQQSGELLLYLISQKGMHLEVIDYCERNSKQEIARYYLTESLLKLPITSGTYREAIDKALGDDTSVLALTQRTKAIMLDQSPQEAYNFFTAEFAKLETSSNQKKSFLVSLYDTLMPNEQELSFETFKEKYLHSSKLAARFAKESFVVNQLEKVMKDKNFEEVENLVNLYAVMREERMLERAEYMIDSNRQVLELKNSRKLDELSQVRKRREQLEKLVGKPDLQTLADISRVMQDQPLEVFGSASSEQIKKVAPIFGDLASEEAANIESRNQELSQSARKVTKHSVVEELTARGHVKADVEKYYSLLDINIPLVEIKYEKFVQSVLDNVEPAEAETNEKGEPSKDILDDAKVQIYLELEEEEQAKVKAIQKDYKKHIKEVVKVRMKAPEILKMFREVDKQVNFKDGSLGLTQEEMEDKVDEEKVDQYNAEFYEDYQKEKRHRQQYIDRLQAQYPDLDIQHIVDREPMKELSSIENPALDDTFDEDDSQSSEDLDEAALEAKELEEEKEMNEFLHAAGLADANGKLDPIIEAELKQNFINMKKENQLRKLIAAEEEVEMSEELDENELNEMLERRLELINEEEAVKGEVRDGYYHPISDLSDQEELTDANKVMRQLWQSIDAQTELWIKDNLQELATPRIDDYILDEKLLKSLKVQNQYEDPKNSYKFNMKPFKLTDQQENIDEIKELRYQIHSKPLDALDMQNNPKQVQAEMHDATVYSMKEELLNAMNKRKYHALPVLIKIFNKIQNQKLGESFKLEDFEQENVNDFAVLDRNDKKIEIVNEVQVRDYGKTIQKLDLLLNDSRSPLISALLETQKYKDSRLPQDAREYYPDAESWVREPLDISAYHRDLDKLAILKYELQRIEKTVENVNERVRTSIENVDGDINQLLIKAKNKEAEKMHEKNMSRLRTLHNDFNANRSNSTSDEFKVRVMRDILALELGQQFDVNSETDRTATQFPVFYALDLINFGIQQNQPAAVRLGEKLLSESVAVKDAKLPQNLAISMKNYMLDHKNNMGYRDAMKITGPLNSSQIYHMANQQSAAQGITYCLDDPYWQEFTMKNRRREDSWRNPSVFAYRYKQYGLLGEILDMQSLQKKYDQVFNKPI